MMLWRHFPATSGLVGLNLLLFWYMLKALGRANEYEDEDGDVDDEDGQNLSLLL